MQPVPEAAQNSQGFADRLAALAERNEQPTLLELSRDYRVDPRTARDAVSTQLMETYRVSGSKDAFTLLYELNHEDFLKIIYHHLRRACFPLDASDILQEVFFNVYRYPFKFKPERPTAFRNWTHSIIRNTVLKHSRRAQRDRVLPLGMSGSAADEDRQVLEPVDTHARQPVDEVADEESAQNLVRAYQLYLHFYIQAYRLLTPREKRVLHMVEVQGLAYRDIAEQLDVRVENMKMIVFRARRKIHSIMKRKFQWGVA